MKISTKGRYALRMLIDLAQHQNEGFIALKEIASRQSISKKYLEQIVPLMNKSGLLRTNRGYQGGYMLAKTPSEYTLGEILRVTEGSLAPIPGLDQPPLETNNADENLTIEVWQGLYDVINKYVDSVNLEDILDRGCAGDDYCI